MRGVHGRFNRFLDPEMPDVGDDADDLTRDPRLNHRLEVSRGVLERECHDLLRFFFRALRNKQLIAKPKER